MANASVMSDIIKQLNVCFWPLLLLLQSIYYYFTEQQIGWMTTAVEFESCWSKQRCWCGSQTYCRYLHSKALWWVSLISGSTVTTLIWARHTTIQALLGLVHVAPVQGHMLPYRSSVGYCHLGLGPVWTKLEHHRTERFLPVYRTSCSLLQLSQWPKSHTNERIWLTASCFDFGLFFRLFVYVIRSSHGSSLSSLGLGSVHRPDCTGPTRSRLRWGLTYLGKHFSLVVVGNKYFTSRHEMTVIYSWHLKWGSSPNGHGSPGQRWSV